MIARLWSARATPQNWPAYEKHFIDHVVSELRTQKGYVAANLLKREDGEEIAITVVSFWRSLDDSSRTTAFSFRRRMTSASSRRPRARSNGCLIPRGRSARSGGCA